MEHIKRKKGLVREIRLFLGEAENPLLAPRGVCLVGNRLMISDTGQNRVFIWNQLPTSLHQAPDITLGQVAAAGVSRNAGGKVSGSTLMYPSGIWSDGQRLIVADAWNHRVLIWTHFPTADGQPADVVVGQPDFQGNAPNVAGISHAPSAQSLNWPYGVWSDGTALWVADTGNRRVLYYATIPTSSYVAADAVIGKPDFQTRDYENQDAIWPYPVKISPTGEMAITDTQYYRVLLYAHWSDPVHLRPRTENNAAPTIIGQATINDNGQNQFRWFPEPFTLNWCYDTCFHKDGLWVADTGNSRVLWFDRLPIEHNTPASALLGQASFNVGIENRNSIHATPESMYWPFHLDIEEEVMAVADTGNHRIIFHQLQD